MASLHPPLDNAQDTGQVLYTSLLVLGLDAANMEHTLRTPVNQKIFTRMNKKVGEHILHFLFVCIDREKASKVFRDCWPLFDKRQESQFYKATFEWYKTLQQDYGQPGPTVVAKTSMTPGGPKFITTLRNLIRIALHVSCSRKDSECTIIGLPTFNRCSERNRTAIVLLRASKQAHQREFLARQKVQQRVVKGVQEKAKELTSKYRSLCTQSEKAAADLQNMLQCNERLTQHQKESFTASTLTNVQKEIHEDISEMNGKAKELWDCVENFQQVEQSTWNILSPLLNGTTSLSHIDGTMYSPQVPDMVYKEHAAEINKMGLQGLYQEDKLDLLSLVQYSNLALKSLLGTVRKTHSHARPESSDELNIQKGRVTSLSETVSEVVNKLNTLLPELMESVASHQQKIAITNPSLESIVQEGKPHLCPPTPPLSLVNTPTVTNSGLKYAPLMLTPGTQASQARGQQKDAYTTPSRVISKYNMNRGGKSFTKTKVLYSATVTDKCDKNEGDSKESVSDKGLPPEMLKMDSRCLYEVKKKISNACSSQQQQLMEGKKTSFLKKTRIHKENKKPPVKKKVDTSKNTAKKILTKVEMNVKDTNENERNAYACPQNDIDLHSSLIDKLVEEIVDDDDSGAVELAADSLHSSDIKEKMAMDSGCADGSASETLLDTIEKMSITPRKNQASQISYSRPGSAKNYGTPFRSVTPNLATADGETPDKCNSGDTQWIGSQFAKLIDVTPCGQMSTATHTPTGIPVKDPFKTPVIKPATVEKNNDVSQQLLATLSHDKMEGVAQDINHDLRARMSLLTQSPVRNTTTSLGPKILANFAGLGKGVSEDVQTTEGAKSSADANPGIDISESRAQSKKNLSNLIEQVQKIKKGIPDTDGVKLNTTRDGSKSKFLSFVEKIKAERLSTASSGSKSNHGTTTRKPLVNGTLISNEKSKPDTTLVDSKADFLSNLTRMESLLGDDDDDDGDDTLTGSNCDARSHQISSDQEEEEIFIDSLETEKTLFRTPGRKSSYLPEGSVFNTLTDAILFGEAASSILRDAGAKAEVRRESISSRRQSIVSNGRMSVGTNRRLSDVFSAFQSRMSTECTGILDESDSCLLSTSIDDLEHRYSIQEMDPL